MQLFDKSFRETFFCMKDDMIDASEVVDRFHNVIHSHSLVCNANCICLENKTCLVVSQSRTFYVVRVVGQVNLRTMIDTALHAHLHLFTKSFQQCV